MLPQLAPTASSKWSLNAIVEKTPTHPATETLREVHRQLNELRQHVLSPLSNTQQYQKLQATVAGVLGTQEVSRGVLQIDSIDIQPAQINREHVQHIIHVVTLFASHLRRRLSPLTEYKRLFRERFEDREVNLAFALHEEQGVPFPVKGNIKSPLLEGLYFGGMSASGDANEKLDQALQNLLVRRLFDLQGASGPIHITEQDLVEASVATSPSGAFTEGLFAHVEVLHGALAQDDSPMIELRGIAGSNGLELLTRFCHLCPELDAAVQNHQSVLDDQRDAQAIYAEIIHHPQDRLLNVLRRPRLGTYELVFAGTSDLPREQQIWIDDLSIKLVDGHFELRDRRSGRRVIPRLSSAHNYSSNQLGMYQFLATLQDDGSALLAFKWPQALENLPYLPRVELSRCILSRARWILQKADIASLNKASVELDIGSWRTTRKMPRFVTWDIADNRLPIDLDNIASVGLLLDEIIKLDTAILYECPALNAPLEAGLGAVRNQEWIVPLTIQKPIDDQRADELWPGSSTALTARQQLHAEGLILSSTDNYMYLRIYTGCGYADSVLREYIGPVMLEEQANGNIDHWFVVRYQDSFEHLRLRFCGHDQAALLVAMGKRSYNVHARTACYGGYLQMIMFPNYSATVGFLACVSANNCFVRIPGICSSF
ncbi:MAG: lantibiotic dehydratase [Burkholderiales bacterium]|nr:lantibiotic dehydratase [Burkholderiales bacterium]